MRELFTQTNAKNHLPLKAKVYSGRFLRAGSMPYEEYGKVINIPNKEILEKIAKTHIGVPVIINHTELTPYNLQNEIVGRVSRVFINDKGFKDEKGKFYPADDWAWCDFTVEDPMAINLLEEEGWELSNSYLPVEKSSQNPKYDQDIIDGEGLHLAIVKKGRYNTKLAIHNSKPIINNNFINKPMDILKKLKNTITGIEKELQTSALNNVASKNTNLEPKIQNNSYTNKYFMHNGAKIPVEEVMNALMEHKKTAMENNEASLEEEYDIDGEKLTGLEMLKAYEDIKNNSEASQKAELDKIQDLEEDVEDLESLEIQEQLEKIKTVSNSKPFYKKPQTLGALNNAKASFIKQPPKDNEEKTYSLKFDNKDLIQAQF